MIGNVAEKTSLKTCAAISVTPKAMKTRCTISPAFSDASPTRASTRSSSAGGTTIRSTPNEITSKALEPRAAKNSGLSESRLKSGWASAKAERTAR